MKPESKQLWDKVQLAANNVSDGSASRVNGSQEGWNFKVYKIPNGPIRIDLQPNQGVPRGAEARA